MTALIVLLLFSATVIRCEEPKAQQGVGEPSKTCVGDTFTLSVRRRLNHSTGEWTRTFQARKVEAGEWAGRLELEATQASVTCEGKTTTDLRVVVNEVPGNITTVSEAWKDDQLRFHPRHGKNAILLNDGRSALKLDSDDLLNAVVFTHRPLKNNELFEVRLDKRIVKNNHCFALGVMTHSPEDVEIKSAMYLHKNGTWMFHNSAIYGSAKELSKYKRDLNKIQARDRLGVMRREDGSIHFFMNGEDLGLAVANVPEPVYGIFELWYDAIKGTIVY